MFTKTGKGSKNPWRNQFHLCVLIAFAITMILLSGCGQAQKPGESKEGPVVRKMVEEYMEALKAQNIEKLISMSGIKLQDDMKEKVITGAKQFFSEAVNMDIKSYEIKEVKVEGSIAFVTVEENRKIEPKGGASASGLDTDYKTVTETIVLIKRDGKWKIDGMNTLHLSEIDMTDPGKAVKTANEMGAARVFAIMADPDVANIGVMMAAILAPNFMRARGQGQFTQCQSNMKNIGTALEMYATDNSGHYPDSLSKLSPDYLRHIPTCASAGKDTYSPSYQSSVEPDAYTFYCSGHHHKAVGVGPNYPQYNSTTGLTSR